MYGLPVNRDRKYIASVVDSVKVPEFVPKSGVRIAVTDSEAQENHATGLFTFKFKGVTASSFVKCDFSASNFYCINVLYR